MNGVMDPVLRAGRRPPLHVAVVTETYPPEVNGVALTLQRMVSGLQSRGHRIGLFRPRQSAPTESPVGPQLYERLLPGMPLPGYRGLRFGLPARAALTDAWSGNRPDVVQVVTEGPLGASAIAVARELGIPVVSEFHTRFAAYSRHYGFGWMEPAVRAHLRRLHNRACTTLVPTQSLALELSAEGYRSLRVVARGIDTRQFHPDRRSDALRIAWNAAADDVVVAYVGRLAPEKNLGLLIDAFGRAQAVKGKLRLLLVGDGPARRALQRNCPTAIIAGMRRGEDLATHYASADLFVFPSLTETFGNVTLEALASGLPVVAFDQAAASGLVRKGENGLLVPPGDRAGFIAAVMSMASSPDYLRSIRQQVAATVAHLDWESVHDTLDSVLCQTARCPGNTEETILSFRLLPD